MMNWIVEWGVKKWLVGVANTAISKYNGNIDTARGYVSAAISKVEAVIAFLKSLDGKLSDGKITEAEADEIIEEAKQTASALVSK